MVMKCKCDVRVVWPHEGALERHTVVKHLSLTIDRMLRRPMSLDVVLPIRANVPGRTGELDRVSRGLLPSLQRTNYSSMISKFNVICPAADYFQIRPVLDKFPQFNFQMTCDEAFLSDMGFDEASFAQIPGWFKQQLLKLAAASRSDAKLALVLDADVIALRSCPVDLFAEGKIPYQNMGAGRFRGWFEASAAALGIDFQSITEAQINNFMGVTPEFLSTRTVRSLVNKLCVVASHAHWGRYLMQHTKDYAQTWTEYSLYWLWHMHMPDTDVTYIPSKIYQFVDEPDKLRDLISGSSAYFAVLQSTKLSVDDCSPLYDEICA
jgi:hypothetical protein